MESNKQSKSLGGVALLSAFSASICCIGPLLALISGIGGFSASVGWLEPLRPYLIGLTIITLGAAWYVNLTRKEVDDCGCEVEKPGFLNSRGFLVSITFVSAVLLTLPYFTSFSSSSSSLVDIDSDQLHTIELSVEGMTCSGCEDHVDAAVVELGGIGSISTSYSDGLSIISYDSTITSKESIIEAITNSGYSVNN